MRNLHRIAHDLAQEAIAESDGDRESALDYLHQSIDGLEEVIYYHKAIQFCADNDTSEGEQWLDDCGGIAQHGDDFGMIACRIAFATILCAAQEQLTELQGESDDA